MNIKGGRKNEDEGDDEYDRGTWSSEEDRGTKEIANYNGASTNTRMGPQTKN